MPDSGAAPRIRGGGRSEPVPSEVPFTARALVRSIGSTPLLPLPSDAPSVRLLGKAEWLNPGGSVKDRAAWAIVRDGLERGALPGRRLLDASSGNTGIAYAMLGAAAGFDVTICLPANANRERFLTLEAYGAEVVVTDPLEGTDGAIAEARRRADAEPDRYWYADQYGNPANWRAHYESTGPEIWRQTGGRITHFVAGLGTTGTLVGAGRRLRELSRAAAAGNGEAGGRHPAGEADEVRVVAVEPTEPLHGIEGLKHLESAAVPAIFDASVPHRRLSVDTERAYREGARLAREAGLFVGASSGAAVAAARLLAGELEAEGREAEVVVMLPDGGARYLSDPWWTR